uniref:Uncharacterized protein n=1 Tax=Timema poppense TaxID=170557 RepID=A0A7R9CIG2_TIMPO|nr:unnamed protein product [Timema poppensis]
MSSKVRQRTARDVANPLRATARHATDQVVRGQRNKFPEKHSGRAVAFLSAAVLAAHSGLRSIEIYANFETFKMVWEAPSSILNSDSSCRIFSSQVNSAVEYVKHFELSPPHNWRPSRPPSPKSVERDRLRERERQARAQMSLQAEREAEVVGGPFFGAPVKVSTLIFLLYASN